MKKLLSMILAAALLFALSAPVLAANTVGNLSVDDYLSQGGTITLQNDLECAYPTITKDTVIDLNGHTLGSGIADYCCPTVGRFDKDGNEIGISQLVVASGVNCTIKNGTIDNVSILISEGAKATFSDLVLRGTDADIENAGHIEKIERCSLSGGSFSLIANYYGTIGTISCSALSSDSIDGFSSAIYNGEDGKIDAIDNCYLDGNISNWGTIGKISGTLIHTTEFKNISELSSYLSEFGKIGALDVQLGEKVFTDVPQCAYCFGAVYWALANGVTNGKSATSFAPKDSCTRGEVATFLWRAMGKPEPKTTENPFTDVKESDYYYKAVLWAVENGITNGTGKDTFSPAQTCSNAHIITFLYRAMGEPGKTGSGEWYADAANWAKTAGLLEKTGAESSMTSNCPRGDVVTFLYRELNG